MGKNETGVSRMKKKVKLSAVRKMIAGLTVLLVVALVGYFFSLESLWRAVWGISTLVVATLYIAVKLLFWRCPHCGRLLGNMKLNSDCCYYCEEKLEE